MGASWRGEAVGATESISLSASIAQSRDGVQHLPSEASGISISGSLGFCLLPFWKVSHHDKAHPSQSFNKCWGYPTGGWGQDAALTGGAQLWEPKMPFPRPHLGAGALQALGLAQSLPSPCSPSVKIKVQKSQAQGHLPCQEVREPSREGREACNVLFQTSQEVTSLPQWLSGRESPAVQEIQA